MVIDTVRRCARCASRTFGSFIVHRSGAPHWCSPVAICTHRTKKSLRANRWAVELFFKWIKQNLNIKKFCCRNLPLGNRGRTGRLYR
ncbi:transposase [Rhizobacter sp. Root1221]|uniref:transposase n=1 Tax=Rhizobacter sp. Root1221 TaxID=1736433 RepID=UPI00351120B2